MVDVGGGKQVVVCWLMLEVVSRLFVCWLTLEVVSRLSVG